MLASYKKIKCLTLFGLMLCTTVSIKAENLRIIATSPIDKTVVVKIKEIEMKAVSVGEQLTDDGARLISVASEYIVIEQQSSEGLVRKIIYINGQEKIVSPNTFPLIKPMDYKEG